MEKKTRLRAPNFTSSDNILLCDVLSKYKHIIENKKTDGTNLQLKQNAWMDIAEEFNSLTTGYTRSAESLQQNYKNLKKKAKKNVSDAIMNIPVDKTTFVENVEEFGTSAEGWKNVAESTGIPTETCIDVFEGLKQEAEKKDKNIKKDIMATGGGPPPQNNDDPVLDKVKAIVGPIIDGQYTIYDGDKSIMEIKNAVPLEFANEEQTDNEKPYFTNNRANLKKKPNNVLTRKRKLEVTPKVSLTENFHALATDKLKLVSLQAKLLEIQLKDEEEKLQHNQFLRAIELEDAKKKSLILQMEMEDAQKKYAHNEILRKFELSKLNFL